MTTYQIYFDGGVYSRPKPLKGTGYGSYQIIGPGLDHKQSREQFPAPCTNNQAEYLAMIRAILWVNTYTQAQAGLVYVLPHLEIFTDSQLVQRQLTGQYRSLTQHLTALRDHALTLLSPYQWAIKWQSRIHNVERFGH